MLRLWNVIFLTGTEKLALHNITLWHNIKINNIWKYLFFFSELLLGTKNVAGKIDEDDTDAEESDSDDKYGDAELDRYALYDWIRWNYISIKNTVYSKVHFFPLLINSLKGRTSIKWITEQNNICSSNYTEIALVTVYRLFLF